jgi:hypothetical protein
MTHTPPAGTMKDARLIETEILLSKPKRFVRETLAMPDGYECDWYYVLRRYPAQRHGGAAHR